MKIFLFVHWYKKRQLIQFATWRIKSTTLQNVEIIIILVSNVFMHDELNCTYSHHILFLKSIGNLSAIVDNSTNGWSSSSKKRNYSQQFDRMVFTEQTELQKWWRNDKLAKNKTTGEINYWKKTSKETAPNMDFIRKKTLFRFPPHSLVWGIYAKM